MAFRLRPTASAPQSCSTGSPTRRPNQMPQALRLPRIPVPWLRRLYSSRLLALRPLHKVPTHELRTCQRHDLGVEVMIRVALVVHPIVLQRTASGSRTPIFADHVHEVVILSAIV